MNVFTFVGRLAKDAEVRTTQGGTPVCSFRCAVDAGYGDKKTTSWIGCALWGKRAEGGLPQYLTKGAQVAVSGELSTREYQKNDGSTGFSVEVRVNELTLVGGKQEGGYQQPAGNHQQPQQPSPMAPQGQPAGGFDNSFDDQDIPF